MRPGMNDPDAIAQKLRDLQTDSAPPYDWAEFQRRALTRGLRTEADVRLHTRWHRTAFAAAFAFVMASAALWVRFDSSDRGARVVDRGISSSPQPGNAISSNVAPRAYPSFDAAQWLANLPEEPAIVRVDTHFAVADLEDRIAWLDDTLTTAQLESEQAPHVNALRRERAQLIYSLAQVRYAETLAAGLP